MPKLQPQRTRFELKAVLGLFLAIVVVGAVAGASSAANTDFASRSGALRVTKECSEFTGLAGSFCTITSSNVAVIKPGMRVVYLQAPGNGVLDSDIVVSFQHGSAAFGHVVLDIATAQGRVTLSGGTGKFAHFRAAAAVSVDAHGVWHWDGTYSLR